jgi:DNA primase
VREAGIEINRSGMALCPFHDDHSPSLQVKGDRWRCFGCGENGDAFDWCERFYRMDTAGALKFLAARAGIGETRPGQLEPSTGAAAALRRRELRDRFFAWVHAERMKNATQIHRVDRAIDAFVKTPGDLDTGTAKYLFDLRARLEGIDELLWSRDDGPLCDYYRIRRIDEP